MHAGQRRARARGGAVPVAACASMPWTQRRVCGLSESERRGLLLPQLRRVDVPELHGVLRHRPTATADCPADPCSSAARAIIVVAVPASDVVVVQPPALPAPLPFLSFPSLPSPLWASWCPKVPVPWPLLSRAKAMSRAKSVHEVATVFTTAIVVAPNRALPALIVRSAVADGRCPSSQPSGGLLFHARSCVDGNEAWSRLRVLPRSTHQQQCARSTTRFPLAPASWARRVHGTATERSQRRRHAPLRRAAA